MGPWKGKLLKAMEKVKDMVRQVRKVREGADSDVEDNEELRSTINLCA